MIYDRRAMPLIKQLKRVESAAQKIVERLNNGDPEALTLTEELNALKRHWGEILVRLEPFRRDKPAAGSPPADTTAQPMPRRRAG
jgi:hypothetical protein